MRGQFIKDRRSAVITYVSEDLADEGGRVYLGSTNHADDIRDLARQIEDYAWDRVMRSGARVDYVGVARAANVALAAARAENARLREALEPFAALSDSATNACCKVGEVGDGLVQDDFRRARAALKRGDDA